MPRYFFDLVDDTTVLDQKGIVLPDLTEARKFARTFARELMETKKDLLGESVFVWSVQVSDGSYRPLFSIPFSQASEFDPSC
jgi:hypothetical protein